MPRHLHVWSATAFMIWVIVVNHPAHVPLFIGGAALMLGLRRWRRA